MGALVGFQVPALESDHSTRRATAGKTTAKAHNARERGRDRQRQGEDEGATIRSAIPGGCVRLTLAQGQASE